MKTSKSRAKRNDVGHRLTYWLGLILVAAVLQSGCAYYNTYYNIKKKFKEAEKERSTRVATPAPGAGGYSGVSGYTPPPGRSGSGAGSSAGADKYRKVLETGSKLLEFHPKSRWIDDTLLLMGISYYRLQDWSRSERKFNEVITIYPNSEHVGEARLWKARCLKEQKREAEAIQDLEAGIASLEDKTARARSEALLGELLMSREDWRMAAEHLAAATPDLSGSEFVQASQNYGICSYELGNFDLARKSLRAAAAGIADKDQAFESYIFAIRCDVALGDIEQARKSLMGMRRSSRYLTRVADIDIELAQLAVNAGNVEEGIKLFAELVDREPNGPQRGTAFYRFALVERDYRANLPMAKALLDSAIKAGAPREIQDSARAATDQIGVGIVAIESISALRDSIEHLQSLYDSAAEPPPELMLSAEPVNEIPDHTIIPPEQLDSTQVLQVASPDSTILEADTVTHKADEFVSPARAAADSLLRLLESQAVAEKAASGADNTADTVRAVQETTPAPAALNKTQVADLLQRARRQLQKHYLRAAEFYRFTLSEGDSAMNYYAQAASSPADPQVYWRSNLFLARKFSQDSTTLEQSRDFYQAIVDADSVPLEAQNEARQVLGLELVADPKERQRELFMQAENAEASGETPLEFVPAMYQRVIDFDTTTALAYRSLVAQFQIFDGHVGAYRVPDSVRSVGARIQSMFPDSAFAKEAAKVLAPDDSSSLFLMSDAELANLYLPKKVESIEEEPSETGWPPPEESLRGRRYN